MTKQIFVITLAVLVVLTSQHPASAEKLNERDRTSVQALMATQESYLNSVENVRFEFKSQFRALNRDPALEVTKFASGTCVKLGDKFRVDYSRSRSRRGQEESDRSPRKGVLVGSPHRLIDYYSDRDIAYISLGGAKDYGREFFVLPERSWFSYNLEFPCREVITADESFDYGSRRATLEKGEQEYVLRLSTGSGYVAFTFDIQAGRLLSKVRNEKDETGVRYRSRTVWNTEGPTVFPESIEHFSGRAGREETLVFQLKIDEFEVISSEDVPSSHFHDASIGVSDSTTITTHAPGKRPVTRKPKTNDDNSLKALGKRLRGEGFSEKK